MSRPRAGVVSAGPTGPARAGVFGVLLRAVGVFLWRAALPRSLPVPPAAGSAGETAPRGAVTLPFVAATVWILALAASVGAAITVSQARGLARDALFGSRNDPGTPLETVADELAAGARSNGWVRLHPEVGPRLIEAAERIRTGRASLTDAAAVYDRFLADISTLPTAARILRGEGLAAPLDAALAKVATPWHRGTLAYEEMRSAVLPYQDLRTRPVTRLKGKLVEAPRDHALGIGVLRPDGSPVEPPQFLRLGGDFDIPLVDRTSIELNAVRLADQSLVSRAVVPILEWTGTFAPAAGLERYAVRFHEETASRAPVPPLLSVDARAEVGYAAMGGDAAR